MSDRQPTAWMPIYWGDYTRDTGALNALAHGAYLMLLKHLWCTERGILNDDMQLCRIACCDDLEEWHRVRPALERFFEIAEGMWRHRRVERELAAARRRCESRSAIGRAGAAARWKHVQPATGDAVGITDGNASAMHQSRAMSARDIVDESAGDGGVSESGGNPSSQMPLAMPSALPTASGRQCHPQPQPHLRKNIGHAASPQRPVRVKADLEGFDKFWSAWPNKVKKPAAEKAWPKALAAAGSVDVILAGVERYKRAKPDWQNWPHPATWLNNQQWADEGLTGGAPAMTDAERAKLRAGRARLENCQICDGKGMVRLRYGARHGHLAGNTVSTNCNHDPVALRAFCDRGGFEWPGDPENAPRKPPIGSSIVGCRADCGFAPDRLVEAPTADAWADHKIPQFLRRGGAA